MRPWKNIENDFKFNDFKFNDLKTIWNWKWYETFNNIFHANSKLCSFAETANQKPIRLARGFTFGFDIKFRGGANSVRCSILGLAHEFLQRFRIVVSKKIFFAESHFDKKMNLNWHASKTAVPELFFCGSNFQRKVPKVSNIRFRKHYSCTRRIYRCKHHACLDYFSQNFQILQMN